MNAVPERTPVAVHEGELELEQGLSLHFGGRLASVRVAWRLVGDPDAPVIASEIPLPGAHWQTLVAISNRTLYLAHQSERPRRR